MKENFYNRDVFIEENLGLVHSLANRFRGRGIEYDDLFSAGCVGIIKAYDNFEVERGLCFSTYAVPVILGELKKLFRDGGSVKVSRSIKELSLKINYTKEALSKKLGTEPTLSQIAKELQLPQEQIVEAVCAAQPTLSLSPLFEDEQNKEFDIPVDSYEEQIGERIAISEVLSKISKDEREIIILRYFKNKTQSETAKLLGTTQVQISRKERKILADLKNKLIE